MNSKALFDQVSLQCSRVTTHSYSTSFSLGIRFLSSDIRNSIYSIYGFVRFADEIVDTFHNYPKRDLLIEFKRDTHKAIDDGISLNPILNSFQHTVNEYNIDRKLIDTFLKSMEMDLDDQEYNQEKYEEYILGSAEVVGLMCLKVFTLGDESLYRKLTPFAMKLGSAFQKVNFLRDVQDDFENLGRNYFPNVDLQILDDHSKKMIEQDIEDDFQIGLEGIKQLPKRARLGVYLAYVYYRGLLRKIRRTPGSTIRQKRIRIPNTGKFTLFVASYIRHNVGLL
ncbi:phytoene/squalene synthase family protein [bacterium SCSIO 12741]|nr:phytoene/squalene synthase family protein [bacterium SCSIO 12741]